MYVIYGQLWLAMVKVVVYTEHAPVEGVIGIRRR
jgi:hypothetical protein